MQSRLDRERTFHNRIFCDQTREPVSKFYAVAGRSRRFFKDLSAARARDGAVLDYGCGMGDFSFFLADQGAARVVGIDISDAAITQARARATRDGRETLAFRVMNAEALEFPDATFDLVCGTAILHHLALPAALSELARVLKPTGSAVFTEPLGHNPLINLYRKLTPRLRTVDEHPLLVRDLRLAGSYFGRVDVHFFHLTSLLAVPFRRLAGFAPLVSGLDALDAALFRLAPFTRRYAWTVVLELSTPINKGVARGTSGEAVTVRNAADGCH